MDQFSKRRLTTDEVDEIIKGKPLQPLKLEQTHLPEISRSARLSLLPLKYRTGRCITDLVDDGLIAEASDLANLPISHLLRRARFGKLTLVDLLTNLRPYMLDADQTPGPASPELEKLLKKLANSALCAEIRCDDPRFQSPLATLLTIANALQATPVPPNETVSNLAASLIPAQLPASQSKRALASIRELRQGIRRAIHLRLERELSEVVGAQLDERTANIICRVYGLDGRGGATLQETADEHGLTRERIRQIADRVRPLAAVQPFVPRLNACLKHLMSQLPNRADRIEKTLRDRRLTQTEFRLEGIRTSAELFSKAIKFEITEANGVRVAVKIRRPGFAKEVLSVARRCVSKSGVCSAPEIAESLREDKESVSGVLTTEPKLRWLGEAQDWFSILDSKRNRLLNLILKVSAIAPTINLSELRSAVSRNYRLAIVPPRDVLGDFCREAGWRLEGNTVSAPADIEPTELTDTEKKMVSVLREHGPTLYRTEFQELCAKKGIGRNTFSMYIWTNPLFARIATGVYALTGAPVGPSDVEACLRRNRISAPALADCGWTAEAKPWVALHMSPAIVASGVFPVLAAIREFILGRFTLQTADGGEVGNIHVAKENSWGLGILIRRRGIEPGDFVILEFNLRDRRAKASVGGAELVESLSLGDTN